MVELSNRGRIALGIAGVALCAAVVLVPSYLSIQKRNELKAKTPVTETIQRDKKEDAGCSCTTFGATIELWQFCEKGKKSEVEKVLGLYDQLDKENTRLRKELDALKAAQPKEKKPVETPSVTPEVKTFPGKAHSISG